MTDLEYLRLLINDKDSAAFSDSELTKVLDETRNDDGATNTYRAAVLCLNIALSDPKRMQSYSRGGVGWTRSDIKQSIEEYRARAGDGIQCVPITKVY